jgi:hypothetical protein
MSSVLQLLECMYIRQAIDLLEGLIPVSDDNKEISIKHLQLLIVFSIMWSLGALLELPERRKVSTLTHLLFQVRGKIIYDSTRFQLFTFKFDAVNFKTLIS